jgi:hypothetical protein
MPAEAIVGVVKVMRGSAESMCRPVPSNAFSIAIAACLAAT